MVAVVSFAPASLAHWVEQECECEDAIADASSEIAEEAIIEAMDQLLYEMDECSEKDSAEQTMKCVKDMIRNSY